MILLEPGLLPLLLLNLIHQLLNLGLQALLKLLFRLSVFLDFVCGSCDSDLELTATILALSHEVLVLSHVLFKVIEDLEFLIESDQSVQFVLQLDFLFFELELKLCVVTMLEHLFGKPWLLVALRGSGLLLVWRGIPLLLTPWARLLLFGSFLHEFSVLVLIVYLT